MPVLFLDAMAQAISSYEGRQPQARNYRNNNPGNLRLPATSTYPTDDGGYTIFPSYMIGYYALHEDIKAKITGNNSHGLGLHSSLLDFIAVYAPKSDGNDVQHYAQYIAWWLGKTYHCVIGELSSFSDILQTINQKVE